MSDAVYNEVIQLVARTEDFEGDILEAKSFYERLINEMSNTKVNMVIDVDEKQAIASIDALIARNAKYTAFIREQNALLEQRKNIKAVGYDLGEATANNAMNIQIGKEHREEQRRAAEADAKAAADVRAKIDAAALRHKLKQEEATANARVAHEKLIADKRIATLAQIQARETEITLHRIAAEDKLRGIRNTAAYGVGSTIAKGKVGAGFDIAAGAAFSAGATNLGGTIYMAERAAYALGIGQKTLGEFAEKLGLVKMTGEGAEASMAAFGRGVMIAGGALAAVALPSALMLGAKEFNKELANTSTLLADSTIKGAEFAKMLDETGAAAGRLSQAFNVDIVEVVKGFKTALSTGINADQLEQFGRVAMTTARGLNTSFDDATSILTTFKDAYGKDVGDLAHFSDVLFNAINVGNFQVNDLRSNIGRVLTTSSEAGVGVEDMMGSLATLTRVGMSTSQAITSLNSLIVGIVNPTDKAKASFDRLGLATGSAAFKTRTLLEYLREVRVATANNADIIGELFGEERARRGAIGLTANESLATANRTEIDKTGTATTAANRAMDTFGENLEKVWKTIKNIAIAVGDELLNAANRIFFGEGAFGEATLNGVIDALTVVLHGVKLIGVGIMAVANSLYQPLAAVFAAAHSVGLLIRGDIDDAIEAAKNAGIHIIGLGRSVGELGKAFSEVTTIAYNGIDKVSTAAAIGATKVVESSTGVTDAFATLEKASDAASKKFVNNYDIMVEAVKKLQKEMVSAQFESAYKASSASVPGPTAQPTLLTDTLAKMQLYREHKPGVLAPRNARATFERMLASGEILNPEDPETQRMLKLAMTTWAEASEKARADAATKARLKAKAAFMTANGYPTDDPTLPSAVNVPTTTSYELVVDLAKKQEAILKLMSAYDKLGNMTEKTSLQEVAARRDQLKAVWELTTAEELRVLTKYKAGEIDQATYKSEMEMLAQRKVEITAWWDATTKMQSEANDKLVASTAKRYAAEYRIAEEAYNRKMALYEREEARINKLIEKYKEAMRDLRQSAQDRVAATRGTDYQRRQYRDQIETGIKTVQNIKDAETQLKMVEELRKTIEKFVTASGASGNGTRGNREASEMEAAIANILAKAEAKREAELKNIEGLKQVAGQVRNNAEATNPVANAMRSEAQKVIKETLSEAAKYGMSISGDYKVDIDKVDVRVEGLQKSEVQRMIETAVTAGMRSEIKKRSNNDVGYENGIAPAGVGTGSSWNETKGTWE